MSFTHPDQLDSWDRDAEQAAREAAEHLAAAVCCESCGAALTDDRDMVDGFVIGGACCGRRLALAFAPEVLAVASREAIDAYTRKLVEPKSGRWA